MPAAACGPPTAAAAPAAPNRPPPPCPDQVTLEPYERDHAVVVGVYRPQKKKEA